MIPESRLRRKRPYIPPWNPDAEDFPIQLQRVPYVPPADEIPPPLTRPLSVDTENPDAGFVRRPLLVPENPDVGFIPREPIGVPALSEPLATRPMVDNEAMGAPPPLIRRNNKGRPIGVIGEGDTDQALLTAQRDYKAPVSKKDLAINALLGFLNGGIPGAIGRTAAYGLDQNFRNQYVMGNDIARTEGRMGARRQIETQGLEDELLRAKVDAAKNPVRRGVPPLLRERRNPDGSSSTLASRDNGITWDEVPALTSRPAPKPPVDRPPLLRERRNPDGTSSTLASRDNGNTWSEIPDLASRPPAKETPDNTPTLESIQSAEDELSRIKTQLQSVPEYIETGGGTYSDGSPIPIKKERNPDHKDLTKRARHLADNVREWRMKLKSGGRAGSRPATRRLTQGQESAIRAAAIKRGLDPDIAIQRAANF